MALDDELTIHGLTVLIQAVVLPNDREVFDGGIVEQLLRAAGADGVVSVGIDNRGVTTPGLVRIEQFLADAQELPGAALELIREHPVVRRQGRLRESPRGQGEGRDGWQGRRGGRDGRRARRAAGSGSGSVVVVQFASPGDAKRALLALGAQVPAGTLPTTQTLTDKKVLRRLQSKAVLGPPAASCPSATGARRA